MEETWPRVAFRVDPALAATRPTPEATESFVVEFTVHGPPVSAVPQPAATVRPNASCASAPAGGGGADTVTDCVAPRVVLVPSLTVAYQSNVVPGASSGRATEACAPDATVCRPSSGRSTGGAMSYAITNELSASVS